MPPIEYISQKVNSLIQKYDTRNPFELCKKLNIKVHYKDLGSSMKAFYFYQSRIKNIVINSRSERSVHKILCGHELGHAILHNEIATMRGFQEFELFDYTQPAEYEANLFDAELLIADEELFELLKDKDKSFYNIAKELYVPAELLDFKFRILKDKGYRLEAPDTAHADFLKNDIENYWSLQPGSNRRPHPYHGCALPTEL